MIDFNSRKKRKEKCAVVAVGLSLLDDEIISYANVSQNGNKINWSKFHGK